MRIALPRNSGYANAPHCYFICTMHLLLNTSSYYCCVTSYLKSCVLSRKRIAIFVIVIPAPIHHENRDSAILRIVRLVTFVRNIIPPPPHSQKTTKVTSSHIFQFCKILSNIGVKLLTWGFPKDCDKHRNILLHFTIINSILLVE
jgi:hypothetical protein